MVHVLIVLIRSYQEISSVIIPHSCRFYPTCSNYAIMALKEYGALKGLARIVLRLLKCSPLSKGGYDPVE